MLRHGLAAGLALAWLASATGASAADCGERTGYSACLDANALWLRDGRWLSIAPARVPAPSSVNVALGGEGLWRPLSLRMPGPDPDGNDVRLVDERVDATTLLSFGLGSSFGLDVALPLVLYQRGAGNQGVTSQSASPIEPSTERDPRVGVRYALAAADSAAVLTPRLEMALPLGDGSAYAGANAFTVAPGISGELRFPPFALAADVSARLRPSTELGAARLGSTLISALGASLALLDRDRLTLSAESFVALGLVEGTSARGRALGADASLVPAEWLASARFRVCPEQGWFVSAGAGSALPISSEARDGQRDWFAGPTSPRLRVVLVLGYAAPSTRPPLRKTSRGSGSGAE